MDSLRSLFQSRRLLWLVVGLWGVVILSGLIVMGIIALGRGSAGERRLPELATQEGAGLGLASSAGTPLPGEPTSVYFPVLSVLLSTSSPDLLAQAREPIVIGNSVAGRPLEVYQFGNGEQAYMIVAGTHGGYEINTVALADELILHILQNPEVIPEQVTLYILRSLNPDGMARPYEPEGRANQNGVDLNRNYPVGWQPAWDRDGCWDFLPTTAGPYPASEPETLALMSFLLSHPVKAVVSYHAAAPGFYPAGDPPDPDSVSLSRALARASGYPYPGPDTGCEFTGMMADWIASIGPAAVDVELSDHRHTEFSRNLNLLLALLDWGR